jgi:hypothetical protein
LIATAAFRVWDPSLRFGMTDKAVIPDLTLSNLWDGHHVSERGSIL